MATTTTTKQQPDVWGRTGLSQDNLLFFSLASPASPAAWLYPLRGISRHE